MNHTAFDRSVCFHDTTSGRVLWRIALDMRFDTCPEVAAAVEAGGGRRYCSGHQGVDAEDGAVLHMW